MNEASGKLFGDMLKAARVARGMSRKDVWLAMNPQPSSMTVVANAENGHRVPPYRNLETWAKALDVSTFHLRWGHRVSQGFVLVGITRPPMLDPARQGNQASDLTLGSDGVEYWEVTEDDARLANLDFEGEWGDVARDEQERLFVDAVLDVVKDLVHGTQARVTELTGGRRPVVVVAPERGDTLWIEVPDLRSQQIVTDWEQEDLDVLLGDLTHRERELVYSYAKGIRDARLSR